MTAPTPSSESVSRRMQNTPTRDTPCELKLRKLLHRAGLRYRVDYRPIKEVRRKADVVFTKAKVAVFVDGCFWHNCPTHGTWPKANAEWWREKLEGNTARDRNTDERLAEAGWTVVRIWEHEVPEEAATKVIEALSAERD
ncbi:MAG: very short patch repair endonuclease [Sporichthyaceae bacterium]